MMFLRLLTNAFRHESPKQSKDSKTVVSSAPIVQTKIYRIENDDGTVINYVAPNKLTAWRIKTLFSKEPDTMAWIAGFAEGEILLDIGANVGMYSVWAAKTRKVRIYAFEPESQNYALLNQNIHLNGLSELVTAFCVAISDQSGFDRLYLSGFSAGGSCHSYGEEVDFNLQEMKSEFVQGAFSADLDHLIETGAIEVPHHIKIDVDGLEHKVIAGAKNLLKHQKLKSILVEVNTKLDKHLEILNLLRDLGFAWDESQVKQARRSTGAFEGVGNYVCTRQ